MGSVFFAPFNKVVIEVDYSIYISFDRVVYDTYRNYKLFGDSTRETNECFYILHELSENHPTIYTVIGKYHLFEQAELRFNKLKDEI